jgi:hypothetical protein
MRPQRPERPLDRPAANGAGANAQVATRALSVAGGLGRRRMSHKRAITRLWQRTEIGGEKLYDLSDRAPQAGHDPRP